MASENRANHGTTAVDAVAVVVVPFALTVTVAVTLPNGSTPVIRSWTGKDAPGAREGSGVGPRVTPPPICDVTRRRVVGRTTCEPRFTTR